MINEKNSAGNTALQWACGSPIEMIPGVTIKELKTIVQLLLDHGADKNITNQEDQTALLIAIQKQRQDIVEILMDPIPDDLDLDAGELDENIVVEHHETK